MHHDSALFEDSKSMFKSDANKPERRFRIERIKAYNPGTSRRYHYHDFYELYYLNSGERFYFVKDKTYHIKKGTLVLVKPFDIHYTTSYAKQNYDRYLISFSNEYLTSFTGASGLESQFLECFHKDIAIIKLNMQEQHYVETVLKFMEKEYKEKNNWHEIQLKTSLIQLLIFMNRNEIKLMNNDVDYINSAHKTISEITAFINDNFNQDITLKSISEKFFISQYYLSRIFKTNTGFMFSEYLNGVRVKEAQTLLKNTNKSVTEISEMVGYNSSTHFGRIFKSVTGISPLSYRKLYSNISDNNEIKS